MRHQKSASQIKIDSSARGDTWEETVGGMDHVFASTVTLFEKDRQTFNLTGDLSYIENLKLKQVQ